MGGWCNDLWNVLTYRDYDFTDDNGRRVVGRSIHCYRDSDDPAWHGTEYAKFTIPEGCPAYTVQPELLGMYQFAFDRRGRVVNMVACDG